MTRSDSNTARSESTSWRWYHYYFLLAVVNVVVLGASVWLFHKTVGSYEVALQKLTATHVRQRWIAGLRLMVMQLNAPGNDVFESRQIEEERTRFRQRLVILNAAVERRRELDIDMSEFQGHLQRMIGEETRIFDLLETSVDAGPREDEPLHLQEAVRAMAAMDRCQTQAVTSLTELEQNLLMRVESLLREHGTRIRGHETLERIFVGLIVLILVAVFWYGRKLQTVHVQMVADHERAITERMHRLAAVGEVCAAVAHGIRNPLAAISSSAQLAVTYGSGDEGTRSRLTDILSECRRLDQRVTHLLDFASTASAARSEFDLRDVVDQAVAELRPRFDERNILVEVTFGGVARIVGDRERLVQCAIELLSNALEFSPPHETVSVECRSNTESPGFVDLLVTDRGPGIPPQIAERVFDLFFTTRPGGKGIGLASVKHTVHSLGGHVMIVPQTQTGTRVRLTLPLAAGTTRG